ncbi:hypothetical protein BFC18_04125 [Alteromonas confluentis]|uniref:Chemotaxis protein n=2 Tax=Alteromonas confluentis TaxID=1656094 RepID=A0A1E7ZFI3_9ALTE|nr:hypothetical protein BFC18_04125 [Alteromonas confluentis]
MILLAGVSAAVMVIAFIVAYMFTSMYFNHQRDEQIEDTTTMLAVVLQEPVFSYDQELTSNILTSFVKLPYVQTVKAYDHRGRAIGKASANAPVPSTDQVLNKKIDVIWNGQQKVGVLDITFRLDSNEGLLNATKAMFIILAIIILLTLQIVNWFVLGRYVIKPVNQVVEALRGIAKGDGDLTMRLKIKTEDEIGQLAQAFNQFIGNLQTLIAEIIQHTNDLKLCATGIHNSAGSNHSSTTTQKTETAQVAAALTELTKAIEEVASNASITSEKTNQCNELAINGNNIVQKTIGEIKHLGKEIGETSLEINALKNRSDQINTILVVIKGIAEQTNLLALNAAIEAARAGEMGRGFAVVADEVRALAQRTQASTAEIEEVIKELQSSSDNSSRMMETTRATLTDTIDESSAAIDALDKIITNVKTINDMNAQVANSAVEQNQVATRLNAKVEAINSLAGSVSENADKVGLLSEQLNDISGNIESKVRRFRV